MHALFETVSDLGEGAEVLRRRAHGVIEATDGRFRRVLLRPFPTLVSLPATILLGGFYHRHRALDRCLLYYDQPRRFPNFLAVKYVLSGRGTRYGTCLRVLEALDEIARLKRTDALLCDVTNWRLSRGMMARWGWVPHCPSRWHRHYIKRFYGHYPHRAGWLGSASAEEAKAEIAQLARP